MATSRFSSPYSRLKNSLNYPGTTQPTVASTQIINPYPDESEEDTQSSYNDDFLSRYAKISGTRPERLAYKQAVEQGAPQIERGKLAKILAVLGAGAGSFATKDIPGSVNMAMSAYDYPQEKANARYKSKISGLHDLAEMEDSDITSKLKLEEARYNDYYKRLEEARLAKKTNADIKKIESDEERSHFSTVKDSVNGNTYRIDDRNPAARVLIGHFDPSVDEKTATERGNETFKQGLKDTETAANAERERIKSLQNMKPDDVMGHIRLALGQQEAQGLLPTGSSKYLTADENGVPIAKGDDPETQAKVQFAIGKELSKFSNPTGRRDINLPSKTPSTPSAAVPNIPAPVNTPAPTNIPAPNAQPDPVKAATNPTNGKVAMLDPEGGKFFAEPEEVEDLLNKGAKLDTPNPVSTPAPIVQPPVVNSPTPNISQLPVRPTASSSVPQVVPPINLSTPPQPVNNLAQPNVNFRPSSLGNFTPNTSNPNLGFVPPLKNLPQPAPPVTQPQQQQPLPVRPSFNPNFAPGVKLSPLSNLAQSGIQPPTPINTGRSMNSNPINTSRGEGRAMNSNPPPINRGNIPRPAPAPNTVRMARGQEVFDVALDRVKKFIDLGFKPVGRNQSTPVPPLPPNPISLSSSKGKDISLPNERKEKFTSIMEEVMARVKKETGYGLKVTSGTRTADQQAKLYAQGRTTGKKGRTVTNADGTNALSKHQTGEAVDLRFVDKNGKTIEGNKKLQQTLGRIAKEKGLVWGGDWKDPYDPLHIEVGGQ